MTRTKIEWTDYTFNPVIGCRHGCKYCYAKKMNDRFKWIEDWRQPEFIEKRLQEPYKLKEPSKIFVCSTADLFGDWVDYNWIEQVIKVAKENPQHIFQFLTKNPKRYLEFDFPKNCHLGVTVNYVNQSRVNWLKKKKHNFKFVSIEPLLGDMKMLDLSDIDLVIVGAMTGPNSVVPKKEWVKSIKHPNIFYKNNIKKYL